MKKINRVKIIIAILVFIMTFVNIILFSVYAIDRTDIQVSNTKVEFDVYFKANNQKFYEVQKEINAEKITLYISLNVREGYLKSSEISLGDSNFNLVETEINSEIIESIDFNNNKVKLKQISKGENIELALPIKFKTNTKFDINNFNKKTQVLLNGIYVNNKAENVEIKNVAREVAIYPFAKDIELNLESKIVKFIKTEKNIILEEEITSNIKNNLLAVNETILTVNVPEINGVKPEVYVYVDSSKATNGKLNKEINGIENVYTYDKEDNLITIKLENKADEAGFVSWEKNEQDKVTVTYIYGQSAISDETVKIENKISSTVKAYNYPKEIEKTETIDETTELEIKGTEISINVVAPGNLSKGYLYGKEEKIEYKENYSVDVSNINQEAIEIVSQDDKFINKDETEQEVESYYTQTIISKNNFINILGEDGRIQIFDENSNVIGTINQNTEVDENNQFIIKYSSNIKNIIIKTTEPINIGKLEIENTKYIINTKLTKENIEKIEKIKNSAIVKTTRNEFINSWFINFVEPSTKVSALINNKTLLTFEENRNIEFQVEFQVNKDDDKLFTNPEIKIQMPSYVENLKINQTKILFGNGLQIQKSEYNNTEKTVTIKLDGTQTKHTEINTTVIVNTDILLNNTDIPRKDMINVIVDNDNEQIKRDISIKTISSSELINNELLVNDQQDGLETNRTLINYEENITNLLKSSQVSDDNIRYEKEYDKIKVKIGATSSGTPVKENDTVKEGQYLKYIVEITNTSNEKIENVNIKAILENSHFYSLRKTGHIYDYETELADGAEDFNLVTYLDNESKIEETATYELEVNKTAIFEFQVAVNENSANNEALSNISIDIGDKNIDSIAIKNAIISSKLKITLRYGHTDNMTASTLEKFQLIIITKNISNETLKNITVSIKLPDELKNNEDNIYELDPEQREFDSKKIENNVIYYTFNELEAGQEKQINLLTDVIMEANTEKIEAKFVAKAEVDGENYESNEFIKEIYQDTVYITAKQDGNIKDETIKDGDQIIYNFTITNIGINKIEDLNFKDDLPEGVRLEDIILIKNKEEKRYDIVSTKFVNLSDISLDAGETIYVKVFTKFYKEYVNDNTSSITNYAILSNYQMENIKTNEITYKIDNKTSNIDNNENNDNSNNSNAISGVAWLDENKNGSREQNEQRIGGIGVVLVSESTQNTVQTAITSEDGTYRFDNVENGQYFIRFEYDNLSYSLTTYQKVNIRYDYNSDVIETQDTYGNKISTTDIITIKDDSIKNIDIGFIKLSKFDLKLDKYISGITVQNKQGIKKYTYTDQKLTKVEIPSKYFVDSNIVIEYTISITNEGDIPGYVKKIVDYIPNDLTFNSELNNNWYVASDGYVYNTNIGEKEINPGERIDTQLILTKSIKSSDSDLIVNEAEISEDYNSLGLEDMDSVAGNKMQDEDDISTAELIISIKTGEVIRNTIIIIIMLAILIIGIYKIRNISKGKEK